jgi:hypothetical protein
MRKIYGVIFLYAVILNYNCAAQPPARIIDMTGLSEVKRQDGENWDSAALDMILNEGDVVTTSFESTMIIAVGESTVTLYPLTSVQIKTLDEKKDRAGYLYERVVFFLLTGKINGHILPPMNGETNFSIQSDYALCLVKGSAFEFDTRNISVLNGNVFLTANNGQRFFMNKGETLHIDIFGHAVKTP